MSFSSTKFRPLSHGLELLCQTHFCGMSLSQHWTSKKSFWRKQVNVYHDMYTRQLGFLVWFNFCRFVHTTLHLVACGSWSLLIKTSCENSTPSRTYTIYFLVWSKDLQKADILKSKILKTSHIWSMFRFLMETLFSTASVPLLLSIVRVLKRSRIFIIRHWPLPYILFIPTHKESLLLCNFWSLASKDAKAHVLFRVWFLAR